LTIRDIREMRYNWIVSKDIVGLCEWGLLTGRRSNLESIRELRNVEREEIFFHIPIANKEWERRICRHGDGNAERS
jgi:hypothetical protein